MTSPPRGQLSTVPAAWPVSHQPSPGTIPRPCCRLAHVVHRLLLPVQPHGRLDQPADGVDAEILPVLVPGPGFQQVVQHRPVEALVLVRGVDLIDVGPQRDLLLACGSPSAPALHATPCTKSPSKPPGFGLCCLNLAPKGKCGVVISFGTVAAPGTCWNQARLLRKEKRLKCQRFDPCL